MSPTPLMTPTRRTPSVFSVQAKGAPAQRTDASAQGKKICPFGANCSCVFSGTWQTESDLVASDGGALDPALRDEVTNWIGRGWKVGASTSREVTLERQRTYSFCVNVALTLLTALLWLAVWIPRARHPKIDTWIVAVSDGGDVTRTQGVTLRQNA